MGKFTWKRIDTLKFNKKSIIAIVIVVLVIIAGVIFSVHKNKTDVTYKEIPVERGELIINVQTSGTVSPQNRLEIKPPIAGRIEEVLVKEGQVVKKGKILAWISSNERAALLDSVRTEGDSEFKRWENLIKPTPVLAPINGTIILRKVEAGQSFTNTDSIFTMADRLTVKAQVDETDIAQIKIGQKSIITLDAYPNNPVKGKVVHVAYDATVTNNVTTYICDVLPDDVPEFMRSGMTSNVNIEVSRKENILKLPMTALISDQEGSRVRIKSAEKSSLVPVETGSDDGKIVEITSGLTDGDVVLVEEKVRKAATKSGSPFMPTRPGGGRRR
jgi:macrolide-specific efflux system membrane fusion protein